MNPWKITQVSKIAVILVCVFFQNVLAGFLVKDLVLATILARILKPRFVPLPIPFPLPLKFQKHTHKPYPVPVYSHSLSSHHVGHAPLAYGLTASSENLAGHHELSAFSPLSSEHEIIHATSHGIENLVDDLDHGSDLIHDGSTQLDSIHDDIEAIGGIDVLTDIDGLGENQKWW